MLELVSLLGIRNAKCIQVLGATDLRRNHLRISYTTYLKIKDLCMHTLNFVTSLAFLILTAVISTRSIPTRISNKMYLYSQVASLRRAVSKKSLISLICLG